MARLILKLPSVPYSRNICCNLTYNKCLGLIRYGICGFSTLSINFHKRNLPWCFPLSWKFSKHINSSAPRKIVEDESILNEDSEILFPVTQTEDEEHSEQFRNTLFPFSSDDIIIQLKSCDSAQKLINIVNNNVSNFTSEHYCQVILVLWDVVKSFGSATTTSIGKPHFKLLHNKSNENNNFENNFNNDLNSLLLKALSSISVNLEQLTPEALVCSILYSNRLGVNLRHPLIQPLLMRINSLLVNEDADTFSLSALSRLTITLSEQDELWTRLLLIKSLPLIYKHFDRCNSSEDFRALTITMLSTTPYLREDLLVEYEVLTEELLRNGALTRGQTSAILKAVLLLSNIYYKPSARFMIYKLLQMLNGDINKFFLPHLLDLHKVVWQNIEPHYTIMELESVKQKCTEKLMACTNFAPYYLELFILPPNLQGSVILKDIINRTSDLDTLLSIQHHLTTAHIEACHLFWDKVAQLLPSAHAQGVGALQKVCLRYMNFTSRMGSYRHRQFESGLLSLITTELVEGTTVHQPKEFALLAAFVLSFDHRRHGMTSLSADIVPRILSTLSQFNAQNCLVLSRGIRQGMLYQRNTELQAYLQLDSALNDRTREIVDTMSSTQISTFNMIFRSCINRKRSSESDLLVDILKRCEQLDWSQLNSRSLRNLVYNFHITSALVPSAVDRMVEYCLQNRQYITGDTAGKLAYLCYCMAYFPAHIDSFCAVTADLVTRDHDLLNGLSLLQVALALSFFNQLSPSLNRFIFTVSFLEKLDHEIKNCFAKDKYPLRVRHTLMQLNRSVCLDQPEADVPWFHSKFCEEQKALGLLEVKPKSLLFTDVLNSLVSLLGDPGYVGTIVYAPYGYVIDIQLNLDGALNPVPFKDSERAVHKLALLLHYGENYSIFEQRLKGYHHLKQRHLEILGYTVISLSDSLWNAMYMAEPKAKIDYLKTLIWPS